MSFPFSEVLPRLSLIFLSIDVADLPLPNDLHKKPRLVKVFSTSRRSPQRLVEVELKSLFTPLDEHLRFSQIVQIECDVSLDFAISTITPNLINRSTLSNNSIELNSC